MAADLHFRCFFAGNYREANSSSAVSSAAAQSSPIKPSPRGKGALHPLATGRRRRDAALPDTE
jgi:hypothetical protein